MGALAQHPDPVYSLEDFEALDFGDQKVELIDGRIVAQSFPTDEHGIIVENLAFQLRLGLDAAGNQRCRPVATSALRIRGLDHGLPRDNDLGPDLTVRCRDDNGTRHPVLAVEVLSRSNSANEMADKLRAYKAVRTIQDILCVNQDKIFAVHHRRRNGTWLSGLELDGPDAEIVIEHLNARIPLHTIYDQVF